MAQDIAPPVCLKNQKKLKCIQFQAYELIQAVLLKSQNPISRSAGKPPELPRLIPDKIRRKAFSSHAERAHTDWIKRYIRDFDKRNPLDVNASMALQFPPY